MTNYANDDTGYKDRYVAFLDILGFSQLTEKADQHPNWRAWLRDCINTLKQTVPPTNEAIGFRFVQFSDSIVMSVDRTPEGLGTLLNSIHMLFRNMLTRGILLRGGVAAGNFHHDDHLMFGPALIRAYSFEQSGAPPHVSLHSAVVEDLKPSLISPNGLLFWLTNDPWDGTAIVHVLADVQLYDGVPRAGLEPLEWPAFNLAQLIERNASDFALPPSARSKWRWLQHYWNASVQGAAILPQSHPNMDWKAVSDWLQQGINSRANLGTTVPHGALSGFGGQG